MSGKARPSLRIKTLENVKRSNLMQVDKDCIRAVFELAEKQREEIEFLKEKLTTFREHYYRDEKFV